MCLSVDFIMDPHIESSHSADPGICERILQLVSNKLGTTLNNEYSVPKLENNYMGNPLPFLLLEGVTNEGAGSSARGQAPNASKSFQFVCESQLVFSTRKRLTLEPAFIVKSFLTDADNSKIFINFLSHAKIPNSQINLAFAGRKCQQEDDMQTEKCYHFLMGEIGTVTDGTGKECISYDVVTSEANITLCKSDIQMKGEMKNFNEICKQALICISNCFKVPVNLASFKHLRLNKKDFGVFVGDSNPSLDVFNMKASKVVMLSDHSVEDFFGREEILIFSANDLCSAIGCDVEVLLSGNEKDAKPSSDNISFVRKIRQEKVPESTPSSSVNERKSLFDLSKVDSQTNIIKAEV